MGKSQYETSPTLKKATNMHTKIQHTFYYLFVVILSWLHISNGHAQTAPSVVEAINYDDLLRAAHFGDLAKVRQRIASGDSLETTDSAGRTAMHIATFGSHEEIVIELAKAGADMNALEGQAYDVVTIAAVANDYEMLDTLLKNGASAANITSPYDGTALIAAAHLGHHQVVKRLIDAGAPLDHINNLNWTALIEAVVLGDGGPDHIETIKHLLQAGANKDIPDKNGQTPLDLARAYGFDDIIRLLE